MNEWENQWLWVWMGLVLQIQHHCYHHHDEHQYEYIHTPPDCFQGVTVFLGQETWCYRENWENVGTGIHLSEDCPGQWGSDLRQTWQARLAPPLCPCIGWTFTLHWGAAQACSRGARLKVPAQYQCLMAKCVPEGQYHCLLPSGLCLSTSLRNSSVPLPL